VAAAGPSLAILLLLISRAEPARAQTKSLYWERFDVSLTVLENGDVSVLERQQIHFTDGTFTNGFAVIPLEKTEGIGQVSVREVGGAEYAERSYSTDPYTFYTDESEGELAIEWFFPPVSQDTRTFELEYVVHGAIRIDAAGDKLQWIAISNERDFPVRAAAVTVSLPQGASFQLVDSFGVPTTWEQSGNVARYQATEELSPYDTFEIGVVFRHGFIPDRRPAWQAAEDAREFYDLSVKPAATLGLGALAVALAFGGPLLAYGAWYLRGRDPQVGPLPDHLNEPPTNDPPGVLGTLIDEQADLVDLTASIVDLARRGHLAIEETETAMFGGLKSRDHSFRRTQNPKDPLHPFEQEILAGLFPGGAATSRLSGLKNKFYTRLPAIQRKMYDEVRHRGYFATAPDSARGVWRGIGIVVLVVAFFGGMVVGPILAPLAETSVCVFFALAIAGVAILVAGQFMPVKTRKGAEAATRWRAFKTYLERIEQFTDLKAAGELFERYLPYAVVFGLNQSWVRKFAALGDVPTPVWYGPHVGRPIATSGPRGGGVQAAPIPAGGAGAPGGPGGLQGVSEGMAGNLQNMSDGLTRMLNSTGRTLGSAPSSSGRGGGFRSGGFSGGGGGGGGGRGFR
jgi:hypothetical protein